MSLRVGDLLWTGDVLPSTREICSIRQGSCFNKYPANVSHPPPTRTMTCLLCSICNERRANVFSFESSQSFEAALRSQRCPCVWSVLFLMPGGLSAGAAQPLKEAWFSHASGSGAKSQTPASPCEWVCIPSLGWFNVSGVFSLTPDIPSQAHLCPPSLLLPPIKASFSPPGYPPLNLTYKMTERSAIDYNTNNHTNIWYQKELQMHSGKRKSSEARCWFPWLLFFLVTLEHIFLRKLTFRLENRSELLVNRPTGWKGEECVVLSL